MLGKVFVVVGYLLLGGGLHVAGIDPDNIAFWMIAVGSGMLIAGLNKWR